MATLNEVQFRVHVRGLYGCSIITMSWRHGAPIAVYRSLTSIAQAMANEFKRNVSVSGAHIATIYISPEDKTNGR